MQIVFSGYARTVLSPLTQVGFQKGRKIVSCCRCLCLSDEVLVGSDAENGPRVRHSRVLETLDLVSIRYGMELIRTTSPSSRRGRGQGTNFSQARAEIYKRLLDTIIASDVWS